MELLSFISNINVVKSSHIGSKSEPQYFSKPLISYHYIALQIYRYYVSITRVTKNPVSTTSETSHPRPNPMDSPLDPNHRFDREFFMHYIMMLSQEYQTANLPALLDYYYICGKSFQFVNEVIKISYIRLQHHLFTCLF